MTNTIYGGLIVREYFGSCDDRIYQTVSNERIFAEAPSREAAELLILEKYATDEKRYTPNRTSENHLGDKVFVDDLKSIEEIVAK